MAEAGGDRAAQDSAAQDRAAQDRAARLRGEYLGQTARIPWRELQPHYARGAVIAVASGQDLVEVAVQLSLDNTAVFSRWIANGTVAPVSDRQALQWFEQESTLWAVVAPPWVLVQEVSVSP